MSAAFVDTSAFYAAADRGDTNHDRAKAAMYAQEALMTSDHVLVETWTLIRHRLGRAAAERYWAGIRSGAVRVEPVGAVDLEAAWAIGEAFADQDFSIVDRTSFALMERLGLRRTVAFDDDFLVFRFGPQRRSAFQVIR